MSAVLLHPCASGRKVVTVRSEGTSIKRIGAASHYL
ncbi:unnamed protein product [Toxocara canis]|uniref:Uncharacterized protein n=1 Tax=Toxocara canis TaxID=6265 RepID=A0A3P7GFY9_TOXCA|nr:unnamed protein product [Toxocara canis]